MLLQLLTKALAEMAGTFMVIFVGGGSIILSERFSQFPTWGVPVAWGIVIALMIVGLGNASGAHFNPAVTLAFTVAKRLPAGYLPFYWVGQFAGGLMAVWVLKKI